MKGRAINLVVSLLLLLIVNIASMEIFDQRVTFVENAILYLLILYGPNEKVNK